jgi:hypothetical protein
MEIAAHIGTCSWMVRQVSVMEDFLNDGPNSVMNDDPNSVMISTGWTDVWDNGDVQPKERSDSHKGT